MKKGIPQRKLMARFAPGGPLPDWSTDKTKTGQFQDWVNSTQSTSLDKPILKSDGLYGPNTAAAYKKYGTAFTNFTSTVNNRGFTSGAHYLSVKPTLDNPVNVNNTRSTPGTIPDRSSMPGIGSKLADVATGAQPFVSNIANAMRRPPRPQMGTMNPYTNLKEFNLQDERNQVMQNTNAANKATERNVSANTAEAIKQFNRGQEFSQLNSVNDREKQMNTGVRNQQAAMDAGTTASNNAKIDQYGEDIMASKLAQQREQSANLANASDKMVGIQNEQRKADVELKKAKVLSAGMFGRSGVMDRAQANIWGPQGIDPFAPVTIRRYGGMMSMPKRKINC